MILFFQSSSRVLAVNTNQSLDNSSIKKLEWLFAQAKYIPTQILSEKTYFVGPRAEMITPWSTNAVEITQNMGITGITRIEEFFEVKNEKAQFDPMLQNLYKGLSQKLFEIHHAPQNILHITNIEKYNLEEGLALSQEEIKYLEQLSKKLNRNLTDSEIFGFSQVNSEHCRHKIFNGTFMIDGKEMPSSLFELIKKTTQENPNRVVSAYKDNCAFIEGAEIQQFAPRCKDKPDFFEIQNIKSVISLKAETHNFPTTVEPFNGAATGAGGEIRDRMAGGKGSIPLAGTAVYMTSYPRIDKERKVAEQYTSARKWLYQTPEDILVKASNGASDFGNKFGQPLICGSLLTFEQEIDGKMFAYDKVIMQAGGIGIAKKEDSLKEIPKVNNIVVLLGGDNYRIGMGGGAVSSVDTGELESGIELNAVQRSNPEMQKRVCNAIRALCESAKNPIISIHDHGAGGHLNCLSELLENTGGEIDLNKLPIGDPTLSAKEIVGNESQERIGLVIQQEDLPLLQAIAERERAPIYIVGKTDSSMKFVVNNPITHEKPIDLLLDDMFGNPPKTIMKDNKVCVKNFAEIDLDNDWEKLLEEVLKLEAVACKDWLTNKVDRSVSGKVAMQQCAGELQLPLNNLGIVALDYQGVKGIANSIGHAPIAGLIDAAVGARLAIAEALTNLLWAPIEGGLKGVSLSANWMWPCKNEGEDARLYAAVEATSKFAQSLKINIPTGKDSLSMTQKYPDGKKVYAPGTVIISTVGEVSNLRKAVSPVLQIQENTTLLYVNLSKCPLRLGGSSVAQVLGELGGTPPDVVNPEYFAKAFNGIQELIDKELILAGHDVSAGGLITTLLEMNFANTQGGIEVDLTPLGKLGNALFAENPALVLQVKNESLVKEILSKHNIESVSIGCPINVRSLRLFHNGHKYKLDIDHLRNVWYKPSYLLDCKQSGEKKAKERFDNYASQPIQTLYNPHFTGKLSAYNLDPYRTQKTGVQAAIIREKGSQCDRETAWALHLAGFDVKDVHMTDLISGRETLENIRMIVFVGGFSNSDVLGSAKGWAGAFLYNPKAKQALENFYARPDTLSLGICNGCQLMVELGLLNSCDDQKPRMLHNDSHKFESNFVSVHIPQSNAIMLQGLQNSKLGIWVAHGEGKFELPKNGSHQVALRYTYNQYPANPNGSEDAVAGICSANGRHLAMMPHLERAIYPWTCAYTPIPNKNHEVTPWIEAFVMAKEWIKKQL
ncbi:MAG: phosphoribosylformylglycinamidine synthase [Bacteroidales bacterium]